MNVDIMERTEVIIVGGGPVGLLLANLLGQRGHAVRLFEANAYGAQRSMAIGITPPSLEMLATLNLDHDFIREGLPIRNAFVHENGRIVGSLRFDQASDQYPFILSLPQARTIELLRKKLCDWPSVNILTGWRVTSVTQSDSEVRVIAINPNDGGEQSFSSSLLAGCDGSHGQVCAWADITKNIKPYAPVFVMADYIDASGLRDEAHLFFGPERPVESFPLPGGRRRWIIRKGWNGRDDLDEPFEQTIRRLTGMTVNESDRIDQSSFQPCRGIAGQFYRGRIALCGDAAHIMSPIGGQGMNTGFGDAFMLAQNFHTVLSRGEDTHAQLAGYNRIRRRAFRLAATRSALGMKLGVASGPMVSRLRGIFIRLLLRPAFIRRRVIEWFTMRSLPNPIKPAVPS